MTRAPNSMLRTRLAVLLAASLPLGCADREAPAPPADREVVPVEWEVAWSRGGEVNDTLLLLPRKLAAGGGRVYVLDAEGRRVVAFRASDGGVEWVRGRRGRGPGEFSLPTALTVTPRGEVLVADAENNRISVLDGAGSPRGAIPLDGIAYVESLCALRDGSILLATGDPRRQLVRVARSGAVLAEHELPWEDLRDRPNLSTQKALAAVGGGEGCVVALSLGRGFARYADGRFGATHEYVEAFDVPGVTTTTRTADGRTERVDHLTQMYGAVHGLTAVGDSLAIAFEGLTEDRSRLIDLYRASDGAYLRSYLTPWYNVDIARAGDRYLFLTTRMGLPALVAATPVEGGAE